jgi:phosphatidylinositol-3-phosphatase
MAGLLCGLLVLVNGCGGGAQALPSTTYVPTAHALPNFSHIFVIVMENRDYGDIIGAKSAPYLNTLAQTYGLATASYAVSHPSLPNYLALVGGDTFGIESDCTTCFVRAPNLVDALEAGHKTWRAYMESLPSPCFVGDAYPYAQKHDPFIYFDDIRTNAARCQQIVPLTQLQSDLAGARVPDFVWITPNLCSDMHDCPTATGDAWLASWVPRILASPAWREGGALFITWDEGTTNDGCCQYASGGHIATLVISPLGKPHYQSSTPYDHYSLLRTIADAWGLHEPGHAGSAATSPLVDFFVRQ